MKYAVRKVIDRWKYYARRLSNCCKSYRYLFLAGEVACYVEEYPFHDVNREWRQKPVNKVCKTIVLCTDERTGSHYLAALMGSTGVLGRPYEYFNSSWMADHFSDYPESVCDQLIWARRLGTTGNGVFSLKIHPWTLDRIAPYLNIWTDLAPVYFLMLTRQDLLGQALSLSRARQTNCYVSWRQPKRDATYNGPDIETILQQIDVNRARWEACLAHNEISPLRITYEEVCADPVATILRIACFAQVQESPIIGIERWHTFAVQRDRVTSDWMTRFSARHSQT